MMNKKKSFIYLSIFILLTTFLIFCLSQNLSAAINLSGKKIHRLYGDTRYDTAVAISKNGWKESNMVIIARGDMFPDALAAVPLAGKYDAPILLTNTNTFTSVSAEEVKRLKAKDVYVLGTDDAIPDKVINEITEKTNIPNANIHRIGGLTRYETAALIVEKLDSPDNKTAIIATGEDYPDALSAAAISYYQRMPIILVGKQEICSLAQEALKKLGIKNVILVGGPDVVGEGFETWFKNNGYEPTRLSGDDRYETCRTLVEYSISKGKMSMKNIFLATGENFPDALALGPLAGKIGSPLLLVRQMYFPQSLTNIVEKNINIITNVYIAGGPDVVSDNVIDPKPRFLSFSTSWSEFNREMDPILNELEVEYANKIRFERIDADKNIELTKSFGLAYIPTYFLLDKEGRIVEKWVGTQQKETFINAFDNLLQK